MLQLVSLLTSFILAFFFGAFYVHFLGDYIGPILPLFLLPLGIFLYCTGGSNTPKKGFGAIAMFLSAVFFMSVMAFVLGQKTKFPQGTPLDYYDKAGDLGIFLLLYGPYWVLDNIVAIVWIVIGSFCCYKMWKYNEVGKNKARARKERN
ncbi:hypothetical protein [Vibrio japonicus]|uniref:Uncharacterized protein n=1 Tax=Vibrio japonicus TaxID=1824638 RepID=A0ABY5LHG7_9VIBR|nr:hypothetical protein [Vibrio japonicus]UUM31479.1 hypothetical protein NP165_04940 [Vibrio japonicus]